MTKKNNVFTHRQYMMLDSLFEINHYIDTDLNEVALHHHNFYEVYLLLNGYVDYFIDNRKYKLLPGDILLISPEELHQSCINVAKSKYERLVLWISRSFMETYSTEVTNLTTCFNSHSAHRTNLVRLPAEQRQIIYTLLNEILKSKNSQQYANDVMCTGAILQLLANLNNFYTNAPQLHDVPQHRSSAVISNVLTYINGHYQEDLSLDELASKNFISKYYLAHEFKRQVGTSVYKYIMQKRLMVAHSLLCEGALPQKACFICGFTDYANFYRAFKKTYGISPKEFVQHLCNA